MAAETPVYSPSEWGKLFHSRTENEVLGAGSAGPGKSTVLRWDPWTQITVEHQRCQDRKHPFHIRWGESKGHALYLTRISNTLENTTDKAKVEFPKVYPGAVWKEGDHQFVLPSGYKYSFGHCKDPDSWQAFQSQEYTEILYDELVHFTEEQYRQINTRLRTDDPVLVKMLKIRAMSNPMMRKGGQVFSTRGDPHWVRKRFVDPYPLGKRVLVEETENSAGEKIEWKRLYLPATLFDNPNKAFVKKYEADLLFSPPHIRQALLYGNWYITEGSYYAAVWDQKLHVCRPFKIPSSWRVFRAMDWGFKVPGVIGWFAMDDDENLYMFREYKFQNRTDVEVAKRIREIEIELGYWSGTKERPGKKSLLTGPADTQIWEQRGHQGKTVAETFQSLGIQWVPADKKAGSREAHAQRIHKLLGDHHGGTTTPGLVFFQDCKEIITTLPQIQAEEGNPECPQDGGDDHAHDMLGYGCAFASRGRRGIPALKHDDEWDDPDMEVDKPRGRLGYGQLT